MTTSPLRLRNRALLRSRFGRDVRSVIVWRGPSVFNSAPVELVLSHLTYTPSNTKIGDMVQGWVIAQNEHPQEVIEQARKSGDHPVCGNCEHYKSKACYVMTKSIGSVYNGSKVVLNMEDPQDVLFLGTILSGFFLRMGAYGDPMAVPAWLWLILASMVKGHTGYTHAWSHILSDRQKWAPTYAEYRGLLMASTDSEEETVAAADLGWRCFEVRPEFSTEGTDGSQVCPAFSIGLSCARCRKCDGLSRGARRPSIWIPSHGAKSHLFRASVEVSDLIRATMPWLS